MERPLDIAFHGVQPSPSFEQEIRHHVAKLEARCDRLIGCRVSVEALHGTTRAGQHQTGSAFQVHVTMSLPGHELAVSREPQKVRERQAQPTLQAALRDAFRAAERQLQSYKDVRREDTGAPSASAVGGQVTLIEPGADHGYIVTSTGSQLYFHRDSVTNARFEDLHEGDVVHYVEEEGSAGPVATKIRAA